MSVRRMPVSALAGLVLFAGVASAELTKLNNLCWELLNETPGGPPDPSYAFNNPRTGWLYFVTETDGDLTLSVPGAAPEIIHDPAKGAEQEAMRWLPAGDYEVTVNGTGNLQKLIVRSVASAVYCRYGSNPHVTEYGLYDWRFLNKYVLRDANSMICTGIPDRLDTWADRGRRWIERVGKYEFDTTQEIYDYLTVRPGLLNSQMHGLILDEFYIGHHGDVALWDEAFAMILSDPTYAGKMLIPYIGGAAWWDADIARLMRTVTGHGSYFSWERYLPEKRSESSMWSNISANIGNQMPSCELIVPGATEHMIVALGYLSQAPESLNINPGTNFKVLMDMEMNHLATDSNLDGVAGAQWYTSSYCDEENVRWGAKLYRHYILEGNTTMYGSDPYILPHIQNPDFEDGTSHWTITEAETGSVTTGSHTGYAWLQGRYPYTSQGNTFLRTRRCAGSANAFIQEISNLEPGRYYSMKMITGDCQDLVNEVSEREEHAISIRIDNVEMLTHPDKNFAHVYPNCYSHTLGAFDRYHQYYMNYHWRVFRAVGTTATLTITDWASPTDPGGPVGQEVMFNFIEIQPYLYEPPGCRLNVRSTPVTWVPIAGTPDGAEGTTNYAADFLPDTEVILTAPQTFSESGNDCAFVRWSLVPGLAAHYPINELSGTTVGDVSGFDNHGTVHGATWEETGWGTALSFDGVDDYVACDNLGSLDVTRTMTVSVWVNPHEVPAVGERWIVGKYYPRYLLTYYTNGYCYWYIGSGGGYCRAEIDVGEWSHVAGTFDGTTIRLYVNGELIQEKPSGCQEIGVGLDFRIGGNESGDCFPGKIGDVKVYSRALSEAEIQNEHTSGPGTYAGSVLPVGETTATFTITETMLALAEYTTPMRTVQVQSVPITGVEIAGTCAGTTDYATAVDDDSEVTLTGPPTASQGQTDYEFVRWHLIDRLAAHYPLNEGSGHVAHDVSGNGNDGVIDGATWVADGDGWALSFDGHDGVYCGNSRTLEITGSVTASAWIHPHEIPPSGVEVGVLGKDMSRYVMTYYSNSNCYLYAGGSYAKGAVNAGEWNHVAATFNTDDLKVRFYVNGELAQTRTTTDLSTPGGGNFCIGVRAGAGLFFKGKVRDVKLYSCALSDAEIENDYNSGRYAGTAQPDDEPTLTFTADDSKIALAEYRIMRRALDVQTAGIPGTVTAEITGTHPGSTDYSTEADDNSEVSLTAPGTVMDGAEAYTFVRWVLNGVGQADGESTLTFTINEDSSALAEYAAPMRTVQVQSIPITGVQITGTYPGTTNYATQTPHGSEVTLTAADAASDGDTNYEFVGWNLVDRLAAHYPLNEGTGTIAHDMSGRGNCGSINGGTWVPKEDGYALSFDGIDDSVECGNYCAVDISGSITVSAWIHPDELPAAGVEPGLVGKEISRYQMTYYSNGNCYFYIRSGGNAVKYPVPVGAWTHVAGTFDTGDEMVRFYVNGELKHERVSTYTEIPTGGTLRIGVRATDLFFKGKITYVRIYARTLSEAEINAEYNSGAYAGTSQTPGETTTTFDADGPRIAVARYAVINRTLQVQSTPITGVEITGTPAAAGGTTDYMAEVDDNSAVSLTAPETFLDGSDEYRFVRWVINGANQADSQSTATFHINEDTTAEAVYAGKGDFDGDDDIDDVDFAAFIEVYGLSEGDPGWEPNGPIADFDDEGDVDFADFMEFVDAYGT